jgi:ferredoxin-NADP reductase
VGDVLSVRGPRNNFPLVEAAGYAFIAGGIGVTPLLPMIAEAERRGAPWTLVYGGRTRASMAFADELLSEHPAKVRILPHDQVGLLPLPRFAEEYAEGTAVYCCGPEGLIEAAEHTFGGCARHALHVERFSARPNEHPAPTDAFEVELRRTGSVVRVSADETILQAVLEAGVHAPQSCTEGICGTCEVAVLGGTPEHRDSLLSDDERAANQTMFICVSRSLTTRLAIDL